MLKGLRDLTCFYCPLLTKIPLIKKIKYLNCSNCPLLTEILLREELDYLYCDNCLWLKPSKEKLNKLIILQKYFKKTTMINLLIKQLDDITEVYYQPGNKGFYLLKQQFNC